MCIMNSFNCSPSARWRKQSTRTIEIVEFGSIINLIVLYLYKHLAITHHYLTVYGIHVPYMKTHMLYFHLQILKWFMVLFL